MEKKNARSDMAERFVGRLEELSRGDLAILKRNAGCTLAESRNALQLFYRILPRQLHGSRDEELFFLVATLYANNRRGMSGSIGKTMKMMKNGREGSDKSKSIDRRLKMLLDSRFERIDGFKPGGGEMAYRLRQTVKLADSKEVGIEWPRLIVDLTGWDHPAKYVQKRWAKDFYAETVPMGEEEKGEE